MEWKYTGTKVSVNEKDIFTCVGDDFILEGWQNPEVIEKARIAIFDKCEEDEQAFYLRYFYQTLLDHIHSPNYTDIRFVNFLRKIPNEKLYYFIDIFTQVIELHDHHQQYFSDYLELMKVKASILLRELSQMVSDGLVPSDETKQGEEYCKLLISTLKNWMDLIESSDHRFYFNHRSLKSVQQEMFELLNGNKPSNPFHHHGIRKCILRIRKIHKKNIKTHRQEAKQDDLIKALPNYVYSLEVLEEQIVHQYFSKYYFIKEAIHTLPVWYQNFVNALLICLVFLLGCSFIWTEPLYVTIYSFAIFSFLYVVIGWVYFKRLYVFFLYMRMLGILIVGMIPIVVSADVWNFIITQDTKSLFMAILGLIGVFCYLYLEVNNRHRKVLNQYNHINILKNTIALMGILIIQSFIISFIFNFFLFEFFYVRFEEPALYVLTIFNSTISPVVVLIHAFFSIVIGVMLQGFWDSKSFVEPV